MRFIDKNIINSIFRAADNSNWHGQVHALSSGRECVPIMVNGDKIIIEFVYPSHFREEVFFNDNFSTDGDGYYFIPKIDHRFISIWFGGTTPEEGFAEICVLDKSRFNYENIEFAKMLQLAVKVYFENYPSANQYFFESDSQFSNFIEHQVFNADQKLTDRVKVDMIKEISPPFYGFSVFKD
ncbi:hypothetical protein PL78_15065 [Yersinia entomophaga]|uniref:Uncharacterized protein n=1 Tax=Yersinia entomophaga TaxID=935293 RepID=A0ABM6BP05_YERET|nr:MULTISPECIES: hypothetical protein [Yersinia]ANI31134.1 hypothetical protein PL78_15065 [Yersinia entomophaga]OWF86334.1 hypothetical protein B4914_15090 [Yersinia entomophaga]